MKSKSAPPRGFLAPHIPIVSAAWQLLALFGAMLVNAPFLWYNGLVGVELWLLVLLCSVFGLLPFAGSALLQSNLVKKPSEGNPWVYLLFLPLWELLIWLFWLFLCVLFPPKDNFLLAYWDFRTSPTVLALLNVPIASAALVACGLHLYSLRAQLPKSTPDILDDFHH